MALYMVFIEDVEDKDGEQFFAKEPKKTSYP